ncbi:MAG TPA: Rrf2 family transcriptional regulator [Abditibacteriaceae bacterium]|jgi:Rrf2 family protein
MRLGHTAKYALQALAFLIKCHARDEWGQIADIAREGNIPRKYLEQVLLDLKGAGLVESKKGQHGGYRLSRAPHEISLAQVVAAVQGELVPVPDWLDEGSEDGFATEYGLRDVVQQARTAVQRVFDSTSIEVLVCRPGGWLGNEMG